MTIGTLNTSIYTGCIHKLAYRLLSILFKQYDYGNNSP
jgi:hypothetical protein